MNPLLDFSGLPRFDAVRPEHVTPAITELLSRCRTTVERLAADTAAPSWDNFSAPLNDEIEFLSRAWGIVGHLHSVNDVPEWREAYNQNLPEVTRFYSELGQNLDLFRKSKAIQSGPEYPTLSQARRAILDHEVRDFKLSGAELPEEQKPRFQEIQERLAALSAKFSENLLDATNAFSHLVTDEAQLAGLPEDVKEAAAEKAKKDGREGWKFTLHAPSYLPVMQYAEDRDFRETLYRAYATRASEILGTNGRLEWDNSPLMVEILKLKSEEARLLGYGCYAEVSLVPKMADTPEQVAGFLKELGAKARPFAEKDLAELRAFAAAELGLEKLESWDTPWASEKLRQSRYAFSEQEVKEYLPEPKVLAGLFRVIESLFSVRIAPDMAPVWHPDVRFFKVVKQDGSLVGQFYLDLYARETKRGGAWMDEAMARRTLPGGIQTPVAYLNCNFPAPVGDKPATFSHDDVITLFHECGHGLHHLLTEVDELGVSGIHGVEWDAVELPSQFLENFCWEWDVVKDMTGHVDTGAPLPRELFGKMLSAKNFQSGLMMLRQIEFSLFDLLLHWQYDANGQKTVLDLLEEVRDEVAVLRPPAWGRFPQSFSHIFAGGYSAGYFSYKWAEVLSADAYSRFEEASLTNGSVLDAETGRSFWQEILAVGGSRPALDSFKAFRGREPSVDALLRHNGMVGA
ncbi:MAG: M3 family metallopeptidase [Rhodocyclaceae bacterium]|nr:M3 family metallopeptidase [Rhodocyclaceae bacterium]